FDHPLHVGDGGMEIRLERGQRHVDDRRVDERHARRENRGDERPAVRGCHDGDSAGTPASTECVAGSFDSATTPVAIRPQKNTPLHINEGPKRSSAAAPAHGPMTIDRLIVLENAPMYSPLRPGGAMSATYAVPTGKVTISPNVQITTVAASESTLCDSPIAPKPIAVSSMPR